MFNLKEKVILCLLLIVLQQVKILCTNIRHREKKSIDKQINDLKTIRNDLYKQIKDQQNQIQDLKQISQDIQEIIDDEDDQVQDEKSEEQMLAEITRLLDQSRNDLISPIPYKKKQKSKRLGKSAKKIQQKYQSVIGEQSSIKRPNNKSGKDHNPYKMDLNATEILGYDQYVDQYQNSSYQWKDPEAITFRLQVLKQNVQKIVSHNSQKNKTYNLGLNSLAALTEQQFRNRYFSSPAIMPIISVKSEQRIKEDLLSDKQSQIDWQCYDFPAVKLGQCNSRYAYATLNSIQITFKLHDLNVQPLSIQEIISCTNAQQQDEKQINGCDGGSVQSVFKYVQNHGVGPSDLYQYDQKSVSNKNLKCNQELCQDQNYRKKKVFIKTFRSVPRGDCSEVVYRLHFRALVVKVDSTGFLLYSGGVLDTQTPLDQLNIDCQVTLIGYNPLSEVYKIKNSWGTKWGKSGYAYAKKTIGICQQAYYPILANQQLIPSKCQ